MTTQPTLAALRAAIRRHYLADESELGQRLIAEADLGEGARAKARAAAASFVKTARENASRSGLIDKFLQEYGLSTAEGVTLMRLAEALLRTPDAATADALIRDKVEAGDWAAHKGKSPFPLVNFSTRALMLTAAWLDEVEAKDPTGKVFKATKDLLDRVGEPVIRASVGQAMKIMGDHFVLGETIFQALKRGRQFAEKGYVFSFDMLGEAAHTEKDAQKYFDDYANAISVISKEAVHERSADNPGISVKLSALHPRYEYPKKERVLKELADRMRSLAYAARQANMGFNVDAEEADRLDLSLDLIENIMRDPAFDGWEGFGVVVQAYQRRAPFVIDWLAALARETNRRVMVRLVKGAYWDAEIKRAQVLGLDTYPVYTRKVLTDVSYAACARKLFANTDVFYPQFATHNALTAAMVREMAGDFCDYELQRLHGMGEALHDSLLKQGARSRIYAPVGGHRELLPYLVRRLLENGANSSFVNQLIDPELAIDDVVADPIAEARELNVLPNPAIPTPRDLFAGDRLAAKGWDITDPDTAARLCAAVAAQSEPRDIATPLLARPYDGGDPEPRFNPAQRREKIGLLVQASADLVERACAEALEAQPNWARTPAAQRRAVFARAADLLEERAETFMRLATREAGKTIPDAIAEIREATDFLRYYPNEATRLADAPLGVVACISPWNFPLAIFLGQTCGALAAGNAVIAKPAEQTPLIAIEAVKLLREAGVPEGVVSCLPGDGPMIGGALVRHPAVKGVVFTGSTEVAQSINRALIDSGKHDAALIAETGGINAMIVDSTALLEQAVTDCISSAFQSAGQRCSACRLVCVQDDVADRFCEMLAGAVDELAVGDPAILSTDVGPVIDEDARANIDEHIRQMEQSARLIARTPEIKGDVDGAFIRPVAFEINRIADLKREIFGPVLHVVRFRGENLDGVIDEINALGFGLTLGVHTRIDETMHRIASRARIGNIYINRNQIGAVVGVQPFGGEGLSGTGPKAGGPHYLRALTKRPAPAAAGSIALIERTLTPKEERTLAAAHAAFPEWSARAGRADILAGAANAARGDARIIFERAAEICRKEFEEAIMLPGPTGESNTLRMKGRGVILCLGGEEALARQIALALAAGNAVAAPADIAVAVESALESQAQRGLMAAIGGAPQETPVALVKDARIRAVAFDGDREAQIALAAALASRAGALTPLLTSNDAPWRYAVERTLTINTTAAGGDVRLLSLPE
ncbi:MAG: bifunctional proline dehydrogenase/L-glutamate gamma-semialdehyde dehydrogenase PutA [Alphaproteobacteria bacterium]|nr:bifunctional proline dehydrogenase/L-glutamate gamma-semialdehyde dehydrogenase PutA [Alphaproteobacteria bacterium]